MVTEDQREVIACLESPATHGGEAVERIDTHASIVFLAGSRAWKLKRAVRYEFLDFSTAARRREMCEAETRINRVMAPTLYRGVVPITRDARGSLTLGGSGDPVEWVIEMVRFDQDFLLDRLAERDALDQRLVRPLVTTIARAHAAAERITNHGGVSGIRWVIDGNAAAFQEPSAAVLDAAVCREITSRARAEVDRLTARLESRRRDGFVRRCHGDLHLRNIVLLEGQPTLFDAIEFNDAIACVDVAYDLAFLLMDLWHRGLRPHANLVWSGYLGLTADFDGAPLAPLFLSCRAAVRAKIEAIEAGVQPDARRRREMEDAARQYAALALESLCSRSPVVLAIGGLSGSGKSTLAHEIAPGLGSPPGAVVLRSDEIRKQMFGVAALSRLGPEGYTAEASARVYEELLRRAAVLAGAGCSAILDAVFAREADRDAIERLAKAAHLPFVGVWLDVPGPLLLSRTAQRQHDPSDATEDVVRAQLALDPGPIRWHRIDASPGLDHVRRRAESLLPLSK